MTLPIYLGTANFGVPYGLTNSKKVSSDDVNQMLHWSQHQIKYLDLSFDYEGATRAIGNIGSSFEISTKLKFSDFQNVFDLKRILTTELKLMNLNKAHLVLIRSQPTYSNTDMAKWKHLLELRRDGIIQCVGFSVYEPKDVAEIKKKFSSVEYFQVPTSVADRRFHTFLSQEKDYLCESKFLVRSIFLQGLITMSEIEIPSQLAAIIPWRRNLLSQEETSNRDLFQISISFIKSLPWVSGVVVGANNLLQLKEIIEEFNINDDSTYQWMNRLEILPSYITDPRRWMVSK
jgi:aryl-alcohol dehydrogenase-like predicted oxidoreductase